MKSIILSLAVLIQFLNPAYSQTSQVLEKKIEETNLTYTINKDVSYGANNEQKMDIYISKDANEAKNSKYTVVFLHGGGWYISDKSDVQKYIHPYLNRGILNNLNFLAQLN